MVRGDSFKNKLSAIAAAILIAAGGVAPSAALANSASVNTICADKNGAQVKDKQCTAAKDLLKGANSNKATAAVWTGVSIVCTAACMNWAGTGACTASNVAGSAASTVIQKDFAGGLTSLGGTAATGLLGKKKETADTATQAANGAQDAAADAATEASNTAARKNGFGPCLTAAQTTSQSIRKNKDAVDNQKNLRDLRKNSDEMTTGMGVNAAPVVGTGLVGTQPTVDAISAGTAPGEDTICSEENIRTARGALACVGHMNRDLPPDVTSGRFLADLERITGKSADRFFAEFKDPVTSLANEIGARLPAENQAAYGNGLAALAREAGSMPSAGVQVARAQGGGGYDSGYEFDPLAGMGDALKGLMGGAAGANEGGTSETQAGGTPAVANRAPAFVSPEDKTISIFDRVKWRYGALIQRERMGE